MVGTFTLLEELFGFAHEFEVEGAESADGFGEGDVNDLQAAEGDHVAELPVDDEPGRVNAEPCREDPVVGARRAATLHVAERGGTGFNAGAAFDFVGNRLTDTAQSHVAEVVDFG